MKPLLTGLCAFFVCLPGSGQQSLQADLKSHASAPQITDHMMALSEKTHEPARHMVAALARDLAAALGHSTLDDAAAAGLAAHIAAVFRSAGTSTAGFLEHIQGFKTALTTAGVPAAAANRAGDDLLAIGKQVRGPEDTPVDIKPLRRE